MQTPNQSTSPTLAPAAHCSVTEALSTETSFGLVRFNALRQNIGHAPLVAQVQDNQLVVRPAGWLACAQRPASTFRGSGSDLMAAQPVNGHCRAQPRARTCQSSSRGWKW